MVPRSSSDRRKAQRYETAFDINIRLSTDGTPMRGSTIEIGPNGMRVFTQLPIPETSYVHISFETASNNTFCEGRVVWVKRGASGSGYECGIDIQRWGGDVPGTNVMQALPNLQPKKDRRKKLR